MRTSGIALLALLAVVLLGCPASLDDRCADGACTPRVDADAGTKPPIDLPPGCTLGQTPKESLACVDEKVGVFVSDGTGSDSNPGTIGQPVKSIAAAVSLATSQNKPNIYVCTGNYTSSVDLRTATSVYGGLDCTFKALSPDRPHWTAASPAFALRIADVNDPIVVADFVIDGAPAKADGESSIAVFVSGSKSVRFARVDVTAADGKPGKNAALVSQVARPAKAAMGGGDGQLGGAGAMNTCPDGTSVGGSGGKGGLAMPYATPGLPSRAGGGDGGASGDTGPPVCMGNGPGKSGKPGDGGGDATAPSAIGSLTSGGWTPQKGEPGKDGQLGQGGGGGGGNTAGGGAGGVGGCGGRGGDGGGGGGASIAVVALQSTVVLDACKLTSGTAGKGGNGAAGQLGQPGGLGGDGGSRPGNVSGCRGGDGGNGGDGGAGAGGAGGIAPAVLPLNANVELPGTATTAGTFGDGGAGGKNNPGPTASAEAVLKL